MSNIDKGALREAAEKHGDDDILALLDELEAKDKQIDDLKATAAHSNAGWTEAHGQEARAEAAEKRIAELEALIVNEWRGHDGKWRPESLGLDELVYLKTRKQEMKIPYPAGKVMWMHSGGDMDVMAYKLATPQARTATVKIPYLPADCDRTEAHFKYQEAIREAGIEIAAGIGKGE